MIVLNNNRYYIKSSFCGNFNTICDPGAGLSLIFICTTPIIALNCYFINKSLIFFHKNYLVLCSSLLSLSDYNAYFKAIHRLQVIY